MRLFAALVSVAVLSAFLIACGGGAPPAEDPTATPTEAPTTTPPADGVQVNLEDPNGSGEYMFDPSEFTFQAGEEVTFVLTSETEFHTFTVDALGIDVEVEADETEELTFTFDDPGEYELICIPHEALGMVGTITVQ